MIKSNDPVFDNNVSDDSSKKDSSEDAPQIAPEEKSDADSELKFEDCIYVKSGMLTFKLKNGDEVSVVPIEDEWPADTRVEQVDQDGDCLFTTFKNANVELQLLRRHIVETTFPVTIPA